MTAHPSSALPGRCERHVLRRLNNPIFPLSRRHPSPEQVVEARTRDRQEAEAFERMFQTLLEQAVKLPANAQSELVLDLRERLDKLYEQVCGLMGDRRRQKEALQKLHTVVLRTIYTGAQGDHLALQELERLQQARSLHIGLLEYPLVADLLSPDSPIGEDELVPSLLSESEPVIQAVMTLLDEAQRKHIATEAGGLLERLRSEGGPLPDGLLQRLSLVTANG